jgi:hypothetical protein
MKTTKDKRLWNMLNLTQSPTLEEPLPEITVSKSDLEHELNIRHRIADEANFSEKEF